MCALMPGIVYQIKSATLPPSSAHPAPCVLPPLAPAPPTCRDSGSGFGLDVVRRMLAHTNPPSVLH
jgi:hypothetical protein